MQACRIDNDGFFVEDILNVSLEEIESDPYLVEGRVEGFYSPKWDRNNLKWVEGDPNYTSNNLKRLKVKKRQEIRNAFRAESVRPVQSAGVDWHGGYESGMKLDGAMRLAEKAGLDTVKFFDINNIGYHLTIAVADSVVIDIANKYQQDFDKKQTLMIQIETATTEQELSAIQW